MALRLIDELGLYNTIFANPEAKESNVADTRHWYRAYDFLSEVVHCQPPIKDTELGLEALKRLLLRDSEDLYHAWLLCALVPWARWPPPYPGKRASKRPRSLAGFAVREGIKVENNILGLVEDAVDYLEEVITMQKSGIAITQSPSPTTKSDIHTADRQAHGKAIRRWGTYWRSCVVYALLVQISDCEKPGKYQSCVPDVPLLTFSKIGLQFPTVIPPGYSV